MKGFTEDEKIIAMHINKKYKWMARNKSGFLFVTQSKPIKRLASGMWQINSIDSHIYISSLFNQELFNSIEWEDDEPTRIRDIYDPQILDDAEREYLKTVLKPFHDGVKYVVKYMDAHSDENTHNQEFLFISLEDGTFTFPDFDAGKMYSGMKLGKKYKLNELGITYKDGENE